MKFRTCKKCGWVSFSVSRSHAKEKTWEFVSWWERQTEETKEAYGDVSLAKLYREYLSCLFCGGFWRNFKKSNNDDCPAGSTVGPIVFEGRSEDEQKI